MTPLLGDALSPQEQLAAWRRHIHQNPETGMDTPKTAAYVKAQLEGMGISAVYVAGTGVCATVGRPGKGPCFLLRADMDALPMGEETGLGFAAANGAMHACGHDLHTAMLLGAAQLLKAREAEMPGQVKLMFQPGEEILAGAAAMIEAGVLENPHVDAAAMMHVTSEPDLPAGTVILPDAGPFYAASDWFEILIQGKGGHGAMPQKSVDPINVMCHVHLALQALNSRESAPDDSLSLTVGFAQGGSEAYNVIPDTARLGGTVRTYSAELRAYVRERIPQIAIGVAEAFKAGAETRFLMGVPPVVNSGAVIESVEGPLRQVLGQRLVRDGARNSVSEDFAYVAEKVPALAVTLAAGGAPDCGLPLHHPQIIFNEAALCYGAAAHAAMALGWLAAH